MTDSHESIGLVPGDGVALVGRSSFALVAAAPPTLLDELWPLVDSGSEIDALLETLSAEGLRTLGAFALARIEPDGVRILVRGDASAELSAPSGQQTFDARQVRTWAEHFVADATSFLLRLGTSEPETQRYHVDRGVVPAAAISWPYDPVPGSDDHSVASEPTTVDDMPDPVETVDDMPDPVETVDDMPDPVETVSDEPVASQESVPPVEPVIPEEPVDAAEAVPSVASDEPAVTEDPIESAASEEPVAADEPVVSNERSVSESSGETIHISRYDDEEDVEVPEADPDDPVRVGDDYDALYGHTVHRSVQQAAVEIDPGPADAHEDPSAPDADARPPLPTGGAASEAPPEPGSGGFIARVPISGVPGAGSVPSSAETRAHVEGDHDGLTISAAQLRAMRGDAGAASPAPVVAMGGPTVQALLCRSGHANPPQRSTCRVCAAALDGVPQLVPRPSMGRITMSTGDLIELTRPAVVGRNPKVEGRLTGEVPQVLKLDVGQALSRSHAMIRLEGWQVLVEDLGSANGTVVMLPGRPPQRLHSGEPVLLEPGAVIDLGGEVTGTYDAGV